jgi:multidrug efflux pump subunit AcrA (membrane-fusion protein)
MSPRAAAWPPAAVALLALLLPGCGSEDAGLLVPARRGDIEVGVELRGVLQAAQDTPIRSPRWGEIKRLAPNGSAVKTGDVVLELADDWIADAVRSLRADVEVSAAELGRAEREVAAANRDAEMRLAAARLDLELEVAKGKELEARPTARELADAQAGLELAKTLLAASQEAAGLVAELVKSGYAPQEDLRQAERDTLSAKAALAAAESQLQAVRAGATTFERQQAAVQLESAKLTLDSAAKNVETVKKTGAVKLARFQTRLEQDRAKLADNERQLAMSAVSCPVDGIVLHAPRRGGGLWQAGTRAWDGATIMSVPNLSRMKVLVQVPAERMRDVEGRKGLPARVRIAALSGKAFSGKLTKVSPIGKDEFEGLDPSTADKLGRSGRQVFDAEVVLDEEDRRLRPGLSAQACIVLQHLADQVGVPLVALSLDPLPAAALDAPTPARKRPDVRSETDVDPPPAAAPRKARTGARRPADAGAAEEGKGGEEQSGKGRNDAGRPAQSGTIYVKTSSGFEARRVRVLARNDFEAAVDGPVQAGDLLYPGRPPGAGPKASAETKAPGSAPGTPAAPAAPVAPAAPAAPAVPANGKPAPAPPQPGGGS